jgi:hypothetical protein
MLCNNSQIKDTSENQRSYFRTHPKKGLSIVEVIVVAGVVTMFFASLLSSFYFTVSLIHDSRARQSALTVGNSHMEYIRSLSYDAVGTVAGIPSGNIPQVATTTLNNIEFTVRTLIEYVDDPADGEGVDDANGITTDYKTAKVTITWTWRGQSREIFLLSRVIPRSIETDVGGGTIRVNVYDANVQPLASASVRLINNSMNPAIDVTRQTNSEGIALFGGAPAGAGYEVVVTKPGYSTDGTNQITAELINPSSPPATVAEADITTLNYFIDKVSTLTVRTVNATTYEEWTESFATTSALVSGLGVKVDSGVLELEGESGSYVESGNALLQSIVPTSLSSWLAIKVEGELPVGTTRLVQVYTGGSSPVLILDTDLPGNSGGFTSEVIDVSALSVATYPEIAIDITLSSTDASVTPTVDMVEVSYVASLSPLANVALAIQGNKVIGTRSDATSVYKFSQNLSTNNAGQLLLENLEWDTYTFGASGYTITEACSEHPVSVAPDSTLELRLTLESAVANALRVVVTDSGGLPASGVELTLTRSGYNTTKATSPCGQTSFLPLVEASDYVLVVRVGGTEVLSLTEIVVDGNETLVLQLP